MFNIVFKIIFTGKENVIITEKPVVKVSLQQAFEIQKRRRQGEDCEAIAQALQIEPDTVKTFENVQDLKKSPEKKAPTMQESW